MKLTDSTWQTIWVPRLPPNISIGFFLVHRSLLLPRGGGFYDWETSLLPAKIAQAERVFPRIDKHSELYIHVNQNDNWGMSSTTAKGDTWWKLNLTLKTSFEMRVSYVPKIPWTIDVSTSILWDGLIETVEILTYFELHCLQKLKWAVQRVHAAHCTLHTHLGASPSLICLVPCREHQLLRHPS